MNFSSILSYCIAISLILFASCDRFNTEEDQLVLNQGEIRGKNAVNSPLNDGGSECRCKDYEDQCNSNCAFSTCCVCWNPQTHEGGCACYFGIASCRTEVKEEESAPDALMTNEPESDEIKVVTIYYDRITKLFEYLTSRKIDISEVKEVYNELITKSLSDNSVNNERIVKVDCKDYSNFYEAYKERISSLSVSEQDALGTFIVDFKHSWGNQ